MEVWSPKCKLLTNKETKFRWNLFQLETKNEAILVGFFNRKTKGSFKQWSTFFSSHENCWNGNPLIGVAQTAIFEMWPLNISFIASSFVFFVLIGKIFARKSCQKTFWRKNEYLQKNNPVYGTKIRKFFPSAHPL